MAALTRLEHELAGVVTLEDLAGGVLDELERLTDASGSFLFVFDEPFVPRAVGGSLAPALRYYTRELYREDLVQAACLRHPRDTYLTPDEGNWGAHARSAPYAQFYRRFEMGFLKGVWPTGVGYGKAGMFGLLLAKPKLHQRFDSRASRLLQARLPSAGQRRGHLLVRHPTQLRANFTQWRAFAAQLANHPSAQQVLLRVRAARPLPSKRTAHDETGCIGIGRRKSAGIRRSVLLSFPGIRRELVRSSGTPT